MDFLEKLETQFFTAEWGTISDVPDFESVIMSIPKEVQSQQPRRRLTAPPVSHAQANLNRLSVGFPIVQPLAEIHSQNAISPEVRALLTHYEFHQVQMACSFQPADKYRFVTAHFEVTLTTVPQDCVSQPPPECAIAYDLFPLRIEDEYTLSSKLGISPQVKFTYASTVDAQVDFSAVERSKSGTRYQGRIIAFGLQETSCGWTFSRTDAHELSGSYRLHILICKPRHSQVRGKFSLKAQIQQKGGSVPAFFKLYRLTSGQVIDVPECPLC